MRDTEHTERDGGASGRAHSCYACNNVYCMQ